MVNMNGPVKMASYDMAGKTAVVTGGTKGIGKAIDALTIEDLEKAKAEASEKYGTTYFAAKSMG